LDKNTCFFAVENQVKGALFSLLLEHLQNKKKSMIKSIAQILSFVFHPLLMVTYMLVILLLINPYIFGVNSIGDEISKLIILRAFITTFVIPLIGMLILKPLGWVRTFAFDQKEERIAPYILTGLFYAWVAVNTYNDPDTPRVFASFSIGAAMALFLAFFVNVFSRVSAHAVGMGALLGSIIISLFLFEHQSMHYFSEILGKIEIKLSDILLFGLLASGLVGTSRLLLSPRAPMDLYGGYLIGFCSQLLALRIVLVA
jgi:hypothetical protein